MQLASCLSLVNFHELNFIPWRWFQNVKHWSTSIQFVPSRLSVFFLHELRSRREREGWWEFNKEWQFSLSFYFLIGKEKLTIKVLVTRKRDFKRHFKFIFKALKNSLKNVLLNFSKKNWFQIQVHFDRKIY